MTVKWPLNNRQTTVKQLSNYRQTTVKITVKWTSNDRQNDKIMVSNHVNSFHAVAHRSRISSFCSQSPQIELHQMQYICSPSFDMDFTWSKYGNHFYFVSDSSEVNNLLLFFFTRLFSNLQISAVLTMFLHRFNDFFSNMTW